MGKFFFLAILCVFIIANCSAATLTTYINQKASFMSISGAVQITDPYNGPNSVSSYSAPGPYGNVVFTQATGVLWFASDWTALLPGRDIAINDVESIDVALPFVSYSLGFDFVDANSDSTFRVYLRSGTSVIGSFDFNVPNDIASFIGVTSDVAFNNVQVREISGDNTDDFYGMFYASQTSVPEPATILLALLGIAWVAIKK